MELQELCCKEPTERGAVWFAWNPEVQGCGTEIPSGSALAAHLCALYDAKNDGVDLVDVLRVEETIDEQYAAASIVRLGTHGPLFYHLDTRPQTLLAQFEAYALKPLHGTIASRLSVGNCREICRAMRQLLDDGSFVVVDEVNVEKNTFGHLLSDEELRATCDAVVEAAQDVGRASQACSQTIEGIVKERGEKKSGTWVKRRWYPLTSFKMHRDFYTELSNEFADFHSTHRWISMDTLDGNRKTVRHPLKWFYNFQSHILQRGYCFRQICFCGVPMDEPWYAGGLVVLCARASFSAKGVTRTSTYHAPASATSSLTTLCGTRISRDGASFTARCASTTRNVRTSATSTPSRTPNLRCCSRRRRRTDASPTCFRAPSRSPRWRDPGFARIRTRTTSRRSRVSLIRPRRRLRATTR